MSPEPIFLTGDELRSLTGYKLPALQAKWLEKHGWTFERSRGARPIVAREYALMKLGARKHEPVRQFRPNFDALTRIR